MTPKLYPKTNKKQGIWTTETKLPQSAQKTLNEVPKIILNPQQQTNCPQSLLKPIEKNLKNDFETARTSRIEETSKYNI